MSRATGFTRASILIAVVTSLAALSSCSSPAKATASLVASKTKVGPGDAAVMTGAFSKRKAGLPVRLETVSGTAYQATGDALATDGSGSYKFSYTATTPGQVSLRVVVTDGKKEIASPSVQITVLGATTIRAALVGGVKEVGLAKTATISGSIAPKEAGRTVSLDTSPDGNVWTSTKQGTSTAADGTFEITVPTDSAGPVQLRAVVAESSTNAAGQSSVLRLYIADYKAAGAKYLACVKAANSAIDVREKAAASFDAGSISLTALEKTDTALSKAERTQITCFGSYAWPPSVASLIDDLAEQNAVVVDAATRMAHAATPDAYHAILYSPELQAAESAGSADAAKIRRGLGLPARK
jgi:hypothetical protein